MSNQDIIQRYIEVTADNLPLTCPMPNTSLWNSHPKASISFKNGNETRCPYCGELYRLKGEHKGHH